MGDLNQDVHLSYDIWHFEVRVRGESLLTDTYQLFQAILSEKGNYAGI